MHVSDPPGMARAGAPIRRVVLAVCEAAATAAAVLLVAAAHLLVYMALDGELPSTQMLRGAPRLICGLLHACSA